VAAGLTNVAHAIALAGLAGEAALTIIDVIENPAMAPVAIAGMLTAGRLSTGKQYKDAAPARRQMSSNDMGKLGDSFKRNDATVQRIMGVCHR
jgi:hypothetical protein